MNRPDPAGLSRPDPNRLASSITDRADALGGQSISHSDIIIIYIFFLCSGMASPICETVWFLVQAIAIRLGKLDLFGQRGGGLFLRRARVRRLVGGGGWFNSSGPYPTGDCFSPQ